MAMMTNSTKKVGMSTLFAFSMPRDTPRIMMPKVMASPSKWKPTLPKSDAMAPKKAPVSVWAISSPVIAENR